MLPRCAIASGTVNTGVHKKDHIFYKTQDSPESTLSTKRFHVTLEHLSFGLCRGTCCFHLILLGAQKGSEHKPHDMVMMTTGSM